MLRFSLRLAMLVLVGVPFWLSCKGLGNSPTEPSGPKTGEEYCGQRPNFLGGGKEFFCGTSQGNLQSAGPFQGYCQISSENIGLVGYSAYDSNGGAFPVVGTQSEASQNCSGDAFCLGYIRCTRLP